MNFSDLTTLKIGGPVKKILRANTESELEKNLQSLIINHQSYLVIGSGSNLLVSDTGFDGVVIKNEIKGIEKKENNLIVKSGTILQDLVDFANKEGLSGLENLAGIPGTLGGAIYGNAGAYGQTISDHLVNAKVFDAFSFQPRLNRGQLSAFSQIDCEFTYRDSIFKRSRNIIMEAAFSLTPSDPKFLKKISQ